MVMGQECLPGYKDTLLDFGVCSLGALCSASGRSEYEKLRSEGSSCITLLMSGSSASPMYVSEDV